VGTTLTPIKDAVELAKAHVAALFTDEGMSQIGLEEIEFDPEARVWKVTIGFSRIHDGPPIRRERAYKIVLVSDASRSVLAIKDRLLSA
jgi:hypothetical protein